MFLSENGNLNVLIYNILETRKLQLLKGGNENETIEKYNFVLGPGSSLPGI